MYRGRIDRTHAVQRAAAGVSLYLVRNLVSEGMLNSRSTRIHPALNHENKLERIEWVMSFINEDKCKFELMYDVVHVDEKWFNAEMDERSYLILSGEEPPQRSWRSKRFIPQTIFLPAVARPRYDFDIPSYFYMLLINYECVFRQV